MTERSIPLADAAATERLGALLGGVLAPGDLLALEGELGAGKTTLVRGLVVGAGGNADAVRSPTFVLHHVYRGGRVVVHHLDLHRLGPGASLARLDVEGLLEEGVVAVEWADLADLHHLRPVRLRLDDASGGGRTAHVLAAPERVLAVLEAPG